MILIDEYDNFANIIINWNILSIDFLKNRNYTKLG